MDFRLENYVFDKPIFGDLPDEQYFPIRPSGGWLLNEGAGGIAYDSYQNNKLTLPSGVTWKPIKGCQYSNGLFFDGATGYATGNSGYNLATSSPFWMMAWMTCYGLSSQYQGIISFSNASTSRCEIFINPSGSGSVFGVTAWNSFSVTSLSPTLNQLYFLVFNFDGTNVGLWINGVRYTLGSPTVTSGGTPSVFRLGMLATTFISYFLNGTILQVAIGTGVLTQAQIFQMYSEPFGHIQKSTNKKYFPATMSIAFSGSGLAQSFSNTNEKVLRPLNSQLESLSLANGNEQILRPLASQLLSQSLINSSVKILRPLNSQFESQSESSVNDEIAKALSSQFESQSESSVNDKIARALSSQFESCSYSTSDEAILRPLASEEIAQSYSMADENILRPLMSKEISQSFSYSPESVLRPLNSTELSQGYSIGVESILRLFTTLVSDQSYSNASDKILRKLSAQSEDISYNSANDEIARALTSQSEEFSYNNANAEIARVLQSIAITVSSANGNFYFAGFVLLTSKTIGQSFGRGFNVDPTTVQQLIGKAESNSYSYVKPIYYVNFGSKALSQSYFTRVSVGLHLELHSTFSSGSYGQAKVSQPYHLTVELASMFLSSSYSRTVENIAKQLSSKAISVAYNLSDSESILQNKHGKVLEVGYSDVSISVKRNLQSKALEISYDSVHNQILVGFFSRVVSQSKATGDEVVVRPLSAQADSVSYMNGNELVTRHLDGQGISQSYELSIRVNITKMLVSKTIEVSESIPEISVSKNLTSKVIEQSKNSATYQLLLRLYGSASSLAFDQGSSMISRILYSQLLEQSIAETAELSITQFKASSSISQSIDAPSATGVVINISLPPAIIGQVYSYQLPTPPSLIPPCAFYSASLPSGLTLSSSGLLSGTVTSEIWQSIVVEVFGDPNALLLGGITIARQFISLMQSVSYSYSRESLLRILNAQCQSISYSYTTEQIRLGLTSKVVAQSYSDANEVVGRKLAASSESQSFDTGDINKTVKLSSQSVSASQANANELINRALVSRVIDQAYSYSGMRITRPIQAQAVSQSYISGYTQTKVGLTSKAVCVSNSDGNLTTPRILSSSVICSSFLEARIYFQRRLF